MSSFFTDLPTLTGSGLSAKRLWAAVQVAPHAVLGLRSSVTLYEVLEDVDVASGLAFENAFAGSGGGRQFFLQTSRARRVLRSVGTVKLR